MLPNSDFKSLKQSLKVTLSRAPQAPDKFNPKVNLQTCGIIQMLYETMQIKTMAFGKSVIALFSEIEPKTSKTDMKKWLKIGKNGSNFFL